MPTKPLTEHEQVQLRQAVTRVSNSLYGRTVHPDVREAVTSLRRTVESVLAAQEPRGRKAKQGA